MKDQIKKINDMADKRAQHSEEFESKMKSSMLKLLKEASERKKE